MSYIKQFSKNHIILFSIIISLITLIISSLFSWDNNPILGFDKLVADILITLFSLLVIFYIGINKKAGFKIKGFLKGLLIGLPFIFIGIGSIIIGNLGVDFNNLKFISLSNTILFTVNMIFIGINEEVSMRCLVLNNLLCKYGKTSKGIYKSVIISALIFGGIHILNIFFMSPITVIVQSINAAAAGVLFAAVFIRSKNAWAVISLHIIVDWLALFVSQCFVGGESVLSIELSLQQGLIMILLGSLPPLLISMVLLRKNKLEQW